MSRHLNVYKERLKGGDIRLIRLKPVRDDSQLECSLVRKSLATAPPYMALSYV
jgi:hypothetical protein